MMPSNCTARAVERRAILKLLGGGSLALIGLPGCGFYAPETGAAFDPWRYPGDEVRPAFLAARAALLAANPHDTQPWLFSIAPDAIDLFANLDRNLGAMDGQRRELHIGLGCALENLVIGARGAGQEPTVTLLPDPADPTFIAHVTLSPGSGDEPLFPFLARRHTNRAPYAEVAPPAGLEAALRARNDMTSVHLHWLEGAAERARFREQTIAATQAIIDDLEMSLASYAWFRQSAEELARYRDGVTLDASGNGALTCGAAKLLGKSTRETSDAYWLQGTRDRQTSGCAFVILSSPASQGAREQLEVGRVYQRLNLWATSQGLAMQPLNQLAERHDRELTEGLEPTFAPALDELMAEPGRRAQMLFRIGFPFNEAYQSPRRPIEWVLR